MTLRRLPIFLRLNLHRPPELQLQVADEGLNLLVLIRRDELGRLQEFLVPFIGLRRRRPEHVAQQPVGDIDMGIAVLLGGILLQVVGDVTRSYGRSHRSGHRWPARNEL